MLVVDGNYPLNSLISQFIPHLCYNNNKQQFLFAFSQNIGNIHEIIYGYKYKKKEEDQWMGLT